MPPEVPADVREATQRHLAALGTAAPGLVTSLYLTGSVTLGDYQPGRSDIDFMAVTTRPVTEPDVVALLAGVHASLPDTGTPSGTSRRTPRWWPAHWRGAPPASASSTSPTGATPLS